MASKKTTGKIATAVLALAASVITGVHTATTPPSHPSCSSSSFVQPVYVGKTSPARWTDVSYFQRTVSSSSYPYPIFAARSNDGDDFRDPAFVTNCRWARSQIQAGKLAAFLTYYVYRPGENSVKLLKEQIGTPFPGLAVMVDVEGWGGKIRGNHSTAINNEVHQIATWLGSAARVVGYGNYYDLASIWPSRSVPVIVADYSSSSDAVVLGRVAGAIGRQYTSSGTVQPFGHPVDVNRSPLSVTQLAKALGVPLRTAPPKPVPVVSKPKVKANNPTVTGVRKVGHTLKARPKPSKWTKGTAFGYQWMRNGHPIAKATHRTYKLTNSDAGKRIRVRVTGKHAGYTSVNRWSATPRPIPSAHRTVAVRAGDSLWSIARRNHLTVNRLIKLNPAIKPPALIYPGERVRVA